MEMMESLLLRTEEKESRWESGGRQQLLPADVAAERAAVTPSSDSSDRRSGSREGGRAPAEAGR